jgi:hypothetical protein
MILPAKWNAMAASAANIPARAPPNLPSPSSGELLPLRINLYTFSCCQKENEFRNLILYPFYGETAAQVMVIKIGFRQSFFITYRKQIFAYLEFAVLQ